MNFTGKKALLAGLIFVSYSLNAQVNDQVLAGTNVQTLRGLAEQWKIEQEKSLEEARKKAASFNLPERQEFGKGGLIEIQGISENGRLMYYSTDNLDAARTVSTDDVWPGGGLGFSLTGTGMTVGEWDGGAVRSTHQELTGRVNQVDAASSLSDHATHVAGTIIASGITASAKGMAYTANLDAHDWNFDNSEMATAASNGMLVSNHSYGTITGWRYNDGMSQWEWWGDTTISGTEDYLFGFYNSASAAWDQIARNAPYYLIVKSAGNDRGDAHSGTHYLPQHGVWSTSSRPDDGGASGYDCISTYSGAKNILTIGAVNAIPTGYSGPSSVVMSNFSGWGPTDDGRIKPDLVANGVGVYSSVANNNTAYDSYNGTSMASPNAAGSLILIQQHYQNEKSTYMRSATLKALAIHTADEAGTSTGPDYIFGWGLLNTASAVQHISDNTGSKSIIETSLSNTQTYSFNFTSNGLSEIKATVCWTDLAGTPASAALNPTNLMLVNDLDVRIRRNSDNNIFSPYVLNPASPASAATTGDNFRDNVEQVLIATPVAGSYTVLVSHKGSLSGGSQNFSLILDGGNIQPQPFNCNATKTAFPDVQDFETFITCNVTPGASCFLPASSGWVNETSDDVDWTVNSGGTSSSSTGPTTDFNPGTSSGNYLYVEASSSGIGFPGKEAILYSPCYYLDTMVNTELAFGYHMYGSTMGSLTVEVYNGISWNQVWTTSGNQGTNWQSATADLSAYDGDTIQLRFIGVTGSNYFSDMAIDGIEIREFNPCPDPFNLSVYNITDTTAAFTWTSSGAYYRVGLGLANGPFNVLGTINFNPVMINGLLPLTQYDFYVQDSCSGGDTSNWVGPLRFTTTGPMTNPSNCGVGEPIADNTCPNLEPYEILVNNAPGNSMGFDVYLKEVNIIIAHTYDADLAIALASPWGDSIALSIFNGSLNDNYGNPNDVTCAQYTTFNDNATISITAGSAPFIGSYRPEDSLSYFNTGGNPNGIWKLLICDDFTSDVGTVEYVELVFDTLDNCAHPTITVSNSGSSSFCAGGSTVLNAQGGTNYQWRRNGQPLSGANLDSLVVTQSGSYNVVNTDTLGCQDSAQTAQVVVVNPLPNVNLSSTLGTSLCQGETTTLSTVSGIGYQWYKDGSPISGAMSNSHLTSTAGHYNVIVTATGNCPDSSNTGIDIVVNSLPNVSITNTGNSAFCDGLSTMLTTSGGVGYQWYRNGNPVSGGTSSGLNVTQSGSYNVRVTNSNSCSDSSASASAVTVYNKPTVSLTNTGLSTFCQGASTTLTGGSWSAYQWYRNGNPISGAMSSSLVVSTSGRYNMIATNANNCTDSATAGIVITVNSLPTVSLFNSAPLTFCQGNSTTLATTAPGTYQWYRNGQPITSASSSNFVASTPGRYNVLVTNTNNCSDSAVTAAMVVVNSLPTVNINSSGNTTFCDGDSITLSTSGGTYQWYRNGVVQGGAIFGSFIASQPGLYNVMVTNANSCKDSASSGTTITVNALPVVSIQSNQTDFCDGDSAILSGDPGFTYQWYQNGTPITGASMQQHTAKTAGLYNLQLTDGNSCVDTAQNGMAVTVFDLPVVTLTSFSSICNISDPLTLSGGSPSGGVYSGTGVTSGSFNPGTAGIGTHVISYAFVDGNGCENMATESITVDNCTGISATAKGDFVIFPNPTSGKVYVRFDERPEADVFVKVNDAAGKMIHRDQLQLPESGEGVVIDLSGATPGIYFIQLEVNGSSWIQKIILE